MLDVSAFGRGFLDFELCLALFAVAAAIALVVDRPERARRSIAELLALTGALLAAGAVIVVPGVAGHAGYSRRRAAWRSRSTGCTSPPARSGSAG